MSDKILYDKICVYCEKPFKHYSRNKRYCSDECYQQAQIKRKQINKRRRKRRREYSKTKEIQRMLSQAYKVAEKVADLFDLPKCNCEFCNGNEEGQQRHHIDGNPLNNDPNNIKWVCPKRHVLEHTKMPDINMVEVIKQAMESEKDTLEALNEIIENKWTEFRAKALVESEK